MTNVKVQWKLELNVGCLIWIKTMKESKVKTVGDLKKLLEHSEDCEPLILILEEQKAPQRDYYLKCTGAFSSGGGSITVLEFVKE